MPLDKYDEFQEFYYILMCGTSGNLGFEQNINFLWASALNCDCQV